MTTSATFNFRQERRRLDGNVKTRAKRTLFQPREENLIWSTVADFVIELTECFISYSSYGAFEKLSGFMIMTVLRQ